MSNEVNKHPTAVILAQQGRLPLEAFSRASQVFYYYALCGEIEIKAVSEPARPKGNEANEVKSAITVAFCIVVTAPLQFRQVPLR